MKQLLLIFLITLFVGFSFAQVPPVISNTYVQDHANVLTPDDEAVIQNRLNELKAKYNLELGVATVPTTGGTAIADYAREMARTYGIGAKDGEKRGILLLLAINDHKWRFEISSHMEAVLTDSQSGEIGRNVLVPAIRKAKDSAGYRDAILATVNATEAKFTPKIEPEQKDVAPTGSGSALALGVLGFLGLFGVLGGSGYGLYAWRKKKREEAEWEAEVAAERERDRLAEIERQKRAEKERKERLAREKKEREEREAHEAWLKTPEGIAETARLKKLEDERRERQRRIDAENARLREEERKRHEAWLKTPEGIADTAAKEKARQERLAREKREREEAAERERVRAAEAKKRREREEEERAERRRREDSYFSSSSYSSSSSSSYDSGSSGSFGGGGDFSGGGSDGSW